MPINTDFMNKAPCVVLLHPTRNEVIETKTKPTLEEMQKYCGGYIELIPQMNKNPTQIQIFGNEEGMIIGLEQNLRAPIIISEITGTPCPHTLWGTIALIIGAEIGWS